MPANLQNRDTDLAKFFTGGEFVRKAFRDFVSAPKLSKRYFVVYGMGGVGKTSVLRMFRLHCNSVNVPVALASGDESKSAIEILEHWAVELQVSNIKLPRFHKTHNAYRTIQARVGEEASKARADRLVSLASKTVETAAGTAVSVALDSIFPGLGMVAGATIGSVIGGIGTGRLTDWLREFLTKPDIDLLLDPTKRLTNDFLDDLTEIADKRRIVLIIDTFEQMSGLNSWVRDCAQRLPDNILLVIAGHTLPDWDVQWPGWMANAKVEQLKPMTDAISRDLVHNYCAQFSYGEPDAAQVEAIIRFADGLPLTITTTIRFWMNSPEDFNLEEIGSKVLEDLIRKLRRGKESKEILSILDAAAVARYFNEPILRTVSDQDNVSDAFAELCSFPFTHRRVGGFKLHDMMREAIKENLRTQNPELLSELHERAALYFEARLAKTSSAEAEHLEWERLYHRIQLDEKAGIRLFQGIAENLARYELTNRLRGLLNDVNAYKLELKHENSRLWLEYYNARLAQVERRRVDAERSYQLISENLDAEQKLRAYALCDWGAILVRDEGLGEKGVDERAIQILERARQAADIDAKLVFVFTSLSRVYGLHDEGPRAIDALQSQLEYFQHNGDQIGIVETLAQLRWTYGRWGNWKKAFEAATQAQEIIAKLPENYFWKSRLVEFWPQFAWMSLWIGRYQETENQVRNGLAYAIKGDDIPKQAYFLVMLGYSLGLQSKFEDALLNFTEAGKLLKAPELIEELGIYKGFLGSIQLKQGQLDKAEEHLQEALSIKLKIYDVAGIPEILNWLGELFEVRREWSRAASYYEWPQTTSHYDQSLKLRSIGRRNFECGAFVGLARVRHAQKDHESLLPLIAKAESLAQQFEYNDHLASLSLMQAQLMWGGPDALRYFQCALIYALRFNRLLLDEVLSGRPQGTTLSPIISYLGERGEEGRQMLVELREWWHAGVNDTSTHRIGSISPIPEAIPLLEAERIARRREPGDGLPQKTVIKQIDQALDAMS